MEPFDLESVYDAEISPLMAQIIAVCKKHGMPMLATFCYARQENDGEDYCTTIIPRGDDQTDAIQRAYKEIKLGPKLTAFTITTISEQPHES